jgi:hypothetical protein
MCNFAAYFEAGKRSYEHWWRRRLRLPLFYRLWNVQGAAEREATLRLTQIGWSPYQQEILGFLVGWDHQIATWSRPFRSRRLSEHDA